MKYVRYRACAALSRWFISKCQAITYLSDAECRRYQQPTHGDMLAQLRLGWLMAVRAWERTQLN
jgi:hypothetical protein